MPEICRFNGITITIYYNDHLPAHFHARHSDGAAKVSIESLEVLAGSLTGRRRKRVLEWARLRQEELREAWRRAQIHQEPGAIAPTQ